METSQPPETHTSIRVQIQTHEYQRDRALTLKSNSQKCKNDSCDSELAVTIKTLNERTGCNVAKSQSLKDGVANET